MIPEIQIPSIVVTILQVILAFSGAFLLALWLSLIIWTFRDARARSRDVFAILLATLMVVIFGPLGLVLYFLLRPPVTLAELYERSLEEEALLQDIEERPRCPGCSRLTNEAWVVCPDCHTKLKANCPNCSNILELHWKLCPFCTAPVDTPSISDDHHHDEPGEVVTEEPIADETRPYEPVIPNVEADNVLASPPIDETQPYQPQAV
ncbi:zinc ribbon domain-containing protein [Anaerolineales bacterium HSG6]|nr:zinc ribbon domain-containing protein [Anaerolineales bacterium HSG6]